MLLILLIGTFLASATGAPFTPDSISQAPQLEWTTNINSNALYFNRDRTTLIQLDVIDGYTLQSTDVATGYANWNVDLSKHSGFWDGFNCQQALAFNEDESLVYLICNMNQLLAINTVDGSQAFSTNFTTAAFTPNDDFTVQLVYSTLTHTLFTNYGSQLFGFDPVTGAVTLTWTISVVTGSFLQFYLRDPITSSSIYIRWINPGAPQLSSFAAYQLMNDHNQLLSVLPTPIPGIFDYIQVDAVAWSVPQLLQSTAQQPPRLYVVGKNTTTSGTMLVILSKDNAVVDTIWWGVNCMDMIWSIRNNPYPYEPNTGIVETTGGMFVHAANIYVNSLQMYNTISGQMMSFPLSFDLTYATLFYEPNSNHFFIITEATLAIIDFSSAEELPRYLWVTQKYLTTTDPQHLLVFAEDGIAQNSGVPYQANPSLRLTWIQSLNLTFVTGVDALGQRFQTTITSAQSIGCGSFNASCSNCQVDTILNSPYTCSWCGSDANTGSCLPMWTASCSGTLPYLANSSSLCPSTLPADVPVWKQAPFWIIFVALVMIALVAVGCYCKKRSSSDDASDDQYHPARI